MRYFIFTLGCQMNVADACKVDALLRSADLKPAPEDRADLIVVVACSVRQSAVDRIYGKLKRWEDKKIIITGCVLPHDKRKLEQKVDLIFDIKDLDKLPNYLKKINKKLLSSSKFKIHNLKFRNKKEVFVPIMTGCDNFCSYCAVPYTRGREISRPEEEIICEVKKLVSAKVRKIVLLGQNVNNYRIKNYELRIKKNPFIELLKKLIKIPGDFKIGFLTSNPWNFPNELIKLIAKEPKLAKEIHLPVQSGDDKILRKMNRRYTSKQYLKLIKNLKLKIKNLYLSTDIIVGFPGETKKQFENTIALCKKAKFDKAYIAMYSPRPGTLAAKKYCDDVPQKEKKRRFEILDKLINKSSNG